MGVDGMNSADIFDEYFDDEKPKYIIRNCDCILSSGRCNVKSLVYCQDCTDCVMKKIVKLYKEQTQFCKGCSTLTCEDCSFSTNGFAEEVIELLDIQEVG